MAIFKGTNTRIGLHIPMINQPVFGAIYAHAGTQVSIEARAMNWTETTKDWDNSIAALTAWRDRTYLSVNPAGELTDCPVCNRVSIKLSAGDYYEYYHDISKGCWMTYCTVTSTAEYRYLFNHPATPIVIELPEELAEILVKQTATISTKTCTCEMDVLMIGGCACGGK